MNVVKPRRWLNNRRQNIPLAQRRRANLTGLNLNCQSAFGMLAMRVLLSNTLALVSNIISCDEQLSVLCVL